VGLACAILRGLQVAILTLVSREEGDEQA